MSREDALQALADRWRDASPREIASAQSYVSELCDALGVEKPRLVVLHYTAGVGG